ncbi:MAG: CDP-diacylglycerol--serine O-phosphatidyltransferase [Pseudomonadales bacterium]|nr:CDP-diacylglycerol--serine O-phosphatidyltransferase [Pseudomonadales bacterium]
MAETRPKDPDDEVHHLDPGDRLRRRGVYLLPNLITTGALFAGFFAIVAGMGGNFVAAALAIYSALILDTLDGRVARWTRSESEFGAEYDSLSDMVAFGVAPALVAFTWALSDLGQVGWVVAFIYMACAGLRLARFNTKDDNTTFTGLASPSAAAIIASAVWIWSTPGEVPGLVASIGMAVFTAVVGLLMVSQFSYFSPKTLDLKGRQPFLVLVAIVLVFAIIFAHPPLVLLLCFTAYALSGPAMYVWNRYGGGNRTTGPASK